MKQKRSGQGCVTLFSSEVKATEGIFIYEGTTDVISDISISRFPTVLTLGIVSCCSDATES